VKIFMGWGFGTFRDFAIFPEECQSSISPCRDNNVIVLQTSEALWADICVFAIESASIAARRRNAGVCQNVVHVRN
jgi:hypothetical protein